VSALTSEALHFRDGQPPQTDLGQRGLHLVELERLDDGDDELHPVALL
jgi:hypothetical protein